MASSSRARGRIAKMTKPGSNRKTAPSYANSWVIAGSKGSPRHKWLSRLYGASRLFVNFFQPSFKLASKHRDGAKVTKRYHPPLTPCDRILQTEGVSAAAKDKLREVSAQLDPLKLLEE